MSIDIQVLVDIYPVLVLIRCLFVTPLQVVQLLIIARDNDSTPSEVKEAVEKSIVSDVLHNQHNSDRILACRRSCVAQSCMLRSPVQAEKTLKVTLGSWLDFYR